MDERRDHDLTEVRAAIDALDARIVALIGERTHRAPVSAFVDLELAVHAHEDGGPPRPRSSG
ncbi:hypothetical protein SAMN06893096_11253 [Geodermatophilus pulveris]|uniref:Chorismate mutase n=1 Tax=Geodermatophilus pulveris TaxID=1564159 RepID=A0A239J241_9ACTN|nr:hypothetical protein [Geodermatophilus pulveris]SNS98734.1 hypothetical protein SAMN06893096_11253 [Geodermatophilus pulveris]